MGSEINKNIEHGIQNFLENKMEPPSERNLYAYHPKARYSPVTLINEWYENRPHYVPPESDSPFVTTYMDHYRKLCEFIWPDQYTYYKMIFDNQGIGKELLLDHLDWSQYDNYITTYDLCYNHLVKGLCGPFPRKYVHGRYLPETDLSLIYGNKIQKKKKDKVRPRLASFCEPIPIPEYRREYSSYDMAEVKKLNDFPFKGKKKSNF